MLKKKNVLEVFLAHVFELKNCFSQVQLAFSEEVAFIQANVASIISFLSRFS